MNFDEQGIRVSDRVFHSQSRSSGSSSSSEDVNERLARKISEKVDKNSQEKAKRELKLLKQIFRAAVGDCLVKNRDTYGFSFSEMRELPQDEVVAFLKLVRDDAEKFTNSVRVFGYKMFTNKNSERYLSYAHYIHYIDVYDKLDTFYGPVVADEVRYLVVTKDAE